MKKVAQILLLILLANQGYSIWAQSVECSCKTDSIQMFTLNKKDYDFSFTNISQGLCFDNIMYENPPKFNVRIFNDTQDTIVNFYRERDAHIYWLRDGGKFDSIYPGQAMTLKGLAPGGKFIGSVNSSTIYLKFQLKDSIYNNKIRVCGTIYPADSKFKIKEIDPIDTGAFVLNENLKFKLNNLELKPIYDGLRLNYRINSGDQFTLKPNKNEVDQFTIPCQIDDTVYYSLFCSAYGSLKKGSFIRGTFNEYDDCIIDDVYSYDEPYWFFIHGQNNKSSMEVSSIGSYHVWKNDVIESFPDMNHFYKLLDSLGITRHDSEYGKCWVLSIGSTNPMEVSKLLHNVELHQTIHPDSHFYDKCYLFFSPKWVTTESEVRTFLEKNKIPLAYPNDPITKVDRGNGYYNFYEEVRGHYCVQIKLPYAFNDSNKKFLNELLLKFEIAYIDAGMKLKTTPD